MTFLTKFRPPNTNAVKYIIFPLLLIAIIAFNNAEEVTVNNQDASTSNAASDSVCRFQVSFISIGSGIDNSAKQQLTDLITTFNSTNQVNIVPQIIQWGREGEKDFLFKLEGIDSDNQEKFIAECAALFKENSLVKLYENMPPKHKGKG